MIMANASSVLDFFLCSLVFFCFLTLFLFLPFLYILYIFVPLVFTETTSFLTGNGVSIGNCWCKGNIFNVCKSWRWTLLVTCILILYCNIFLSRKTVSTKIYILTGQVKVAWKPPLQFVGIATLGFDEISHIEFFCIQGLLVITSSI